MDPLVGCNSPDINFTNVDLPQPFGPTNATLKETKRKQKGNKKETKRKQKESDQSWPYQLDGTYWFPLVVLFFPFRYLPVSLHELRSSAEFKNAKN